VQLRGWLLEPLRCGVVVLVAATAQTMQRSPLSGVLSTRHASIGSAQREAAAAAPVVGHADVDMRDVYAKDNEEPSDREMGAFFSDNSDSDSQGIGAKKICM
jgi:hypothetical protein